MNRLAIAVMPTYHSRLTRTVSTSELNARANQSVVSKARSASPTTTPANTAPQRIRWGLGEPVAGTDDEWCDAERSRVPTEGSSNGRRIMDRAEKDRG